MKKKWFSKVNNLRWHVHEGFEVAKNCEIHIRIDLLGSPRN